MKYKCQQTQAVTGFPGHHPLVPRFSITDFMSWSMLKKAKSMQNRLLSLPSLLNLNKTAFLIMHTVLHLSLPLQAFSFLYNEGETQLHFCQTLVAVSNFYFQVIVCTESPKDSCSVRIRFN